jgi:hypothetical protein
MSKEGVFDILFFGIICLSALTLSLLTMLLAKRPSSRWRTLAMAGVVIAFLVGTPTLLYILFVIKYLFFDAWH